MQEKVLVCYLNLELDLKILCEDQTNGLKVVLDSSAFEKWYLRLKSISIS